MVEQLALFGPQFVQLRLPFGRGTIAGVRSREVIADPDAVRRIVARWSLVSTATILLVILSNLLVSGWPMTLISAVAAVIVMTIAVRIISLTIRSLRHQAAAVDSD